MCSFQLSSLDDILAQDKIQQVEGILASHTTNTILTVSKLSEQLSVDDEVSDKVLEILYNNDVLNKYYAVQCPECELLIQDFKALVDIPEEIYCYNCDETISLSQDNIYVVYRISDSFSGGQFNDEVMTLSKLTVRQTDSFVYKLAQCNYNFNKLLYSPTQKQFKELEDLYNLAFNSKHANTKSKGDAFEDLCRMLFNCCNCFKAANLRTRTNQVDCYVRSYFRFSKDLIDTENYSIYVECKNENKTPGVGYFNKLHSILVMSSAKHGIIMSRKKASKNYLSDAQMVYLYSKVVIINIDKDDIYDIIFRRKNFLEVIDVKFSEIQALAANSLKNLGLV
jgi:hypothetical protein